MHELSIASSILESIQAERARRPGTRFCKVGVRLGEWAGLDPDALSFCFDALVQGSELAPLALEIERCPRRQMCQGCGHTFAVQEYDWACPACGSASTRAIGGDELELAYVEVEEP